MPTGGYPAWSDEDTAFLQRAFADLMPLPRLSEHLGRTPAAILSRLQLIARKPQGLKVPQHPRLYPLRELAARYAVSTSAITRWLRHRDLEIVQAMCGVRLAPHATQAGFDRLEKDFPPSSALFVGWLDTAQVARELGVSRTLVAKNLTVGGWPVRWVKATSPQTQRLLVEPWSFAAFARSRRQAVLSRPPPGYVPLKAAFVDTGVLPRTGHDRAKRYGLRVVSVKTTHRPSAYIHKDDVAALATPGRRLANAAD